MRWRTRQQVVILLLGESAVEGDRRRWGVSITLFDISLQMMATTFEPRSPPLSFSMERKPPPSSPRVGAVGGVGERGVEECVG
jgi:hypothetical protein